MKCNTYFSRRFGWVLGRRLNESKDHINVRNSQVSHARCGNQELTVVGFLLGLRVGDFEGLFVGFYEADYV